VLSTDELAGEASDVRSAPRTSKMPKLPGPPPLPSEARALIQAGKIPPLPMLGARRSSSLELPAAPENPFDHEPLTGRTQPSLPPPLVRFGRFDVLGRVAVGGMAEIYLARENVTDGAQRHVAIKVVRRLPQKAADAAYFEELFLREGRTAAQLTHPGICHVYECGKWGGHFFIAMEWIDGVSLASVLSKVASQGKPMPTTLALTIAVQVAAALDYAHRARDARRKRMQVVHRDVNPHNIMIRHDGVVKLLDFGIAQAADAHADSRAETVKGKVAYMAPEQALREPLDGRADVFALGVCLWEMLTGTRLYRRETFKETLKALLHEPVPSLRKQLSGAPAALEATLQRALQKDPSKRFQSAAELQAALELYLGQAGEVASSRKLGMLMEQLFPNARRATPELFVGAEVMERLAPMVAPEPAPEAASAAISAEIPDAESTRSPASDALSVEAPSSTVRLLFPAPGAAQEAGARVRVAPRLLVLALVALTFLALGMLAVMRPGRVVTEVRPARPATAAPVVSPNVPQQAAARPVITSPSEPAARAPEAADAPPPTVSDAPLNTKDSRATRRRPSPGFVASPGF
jgi:serine/threonine protein kinase